MLWPKGPSLDPARSHQLSSRFAASHRERQISFLRGPAPHGVGPPLKRPYGTPRYGASPTALQACTPATLRKGPGRGLAGARPAGPPALAGCWPPGWRHSRHCGSGTATLRQWTPASIGRSCQMANSGSRSGAAHHGATTAPA